MFALPGFRMFFIVLLVCMASTAVYGQGLLRRQVNIEAKNKPLSEVLKTIGRQGNFYFSYNSNIIRKDSLVTIAVKGKSVEQVLDMLLGPGNCRYIEADKYIILQTTEKEKWYTISGFITDGKTGDALPDVSVFERQQLASTLTGKDGYFMLQLKDRGKYNTAEITVSKGFYIDTSLSLIKGYDQELALTITPETYALPEMIVTQNTGVEKTWWNKLLISSKLKTQNLNLGKFLVDKPYQFSLTPGLGTHGKMSGQVANKVSLNLIGGYSAGVEGVEVGGIFNINKKDVRYVQTAGVCNIVLGNVAGAQMSGISNFVQGNVEGVQCAGIMNKAANVEGAQLAGFINMAFDTVDGVQIAGFMNVANAASVQIAGFMNLADDADGFQLAGFANTAKRADGMQLAGFMNIAERVNGIQMAFLNIADSADFPIGLVNIIGNGDAALGVSVDEFGTTVLALRSGGRVLYGILGLAANLYQGAELYGLETGFGAHLPLSKRFRINTELAVLSLSDFSYQSINESALRVMPAVRVGPVELFAGAGLTFSLADFAPGYASAIDKTSLWSATRLNTIMELRLGYRAGIQVHF